MGSKILSRTWALGLRDLGPKVQGREREGGKNGQGSVVGWGGSEGGDSEREKGREGQRGASDVWLLGSAWSSCLPT
eukprot:2073359-Rhodomonas_salina.1